VYKKIIVGVIVAVGLLVALKGTWAGSHLKLTFHKWGKKAVASVPLEREIERLQMEVTDLGRQDERFLDKVAHQALAVEKLEAQVGTQKKHVARREADVKAMHTALANKDAQVTFQGERYPRAAMEQQLKLDFLTLEADEQVLQSREQHLMELKKGLALNRQKWSELKVQREQMAAELQRLETAVVTERRARAEQTAKIDDRDYRKLSEGIAAVRDRVNLLKKKRELRGELGEGPVRAIERQRQEEAKLRSRMAQRFAGEQQ